MSRIAFLIGELFHNGVCNSQTSSSLLLPYLHHTIAPLILLPQLHEYWYYRFALPHPGSHIFSTCQEVAFCANHHIQ